MSESYDVAIVGAGIVGLAAGMKLLSARPDFNAVILEKESRIAAHQTGHNSGVIHSGLYYRPGSNKARMCVSGARELVRFSEENGVPFELCGKIVAAVSPDELPRLFELHRRGVENGLRGLRLIGPDEARELEPHVRCLQALHVPETGIVDFKDVAGAYARNFASAGGEILLRHKVLSIASEGATTAMETPRRTIRARVVINCSGLYSDVVARASGLEPPCEIVPFRGEYHRVRPERNCLVKNLIYPVPDPRFPFLGVHFTRMIDGTVEAGPNAVLAFAREGYSRTRVSASELMGILRYRGFWKLAARHWKNGAHEMMRSCSKRLFARALQKLVPGITARDLAPGGSGVRAQALSSDGVLLDDFVILQNERMVHVLNAPSPAATSSLAIGGAIAAIALPLLDC